MQVHFNGSSEYKKARARKKAVHKKTESEQDEKESKKRKGSIEIENAKAPTAKG